MDTSKLVIGGVIAILTILVVSPLIGNISSLGCGFLLSVGAHTSKCSLGYYKEQIGHSPDAYQAYERFKEFFPEKSIGVLKLDCIGFRNLVDSAYALGIPKEEINSMAKEQSDYRSCCCEFNTQCDYYQESDCSSRGGSILGDRCDIRGRICIS